MRLFYAMELDSISQRRLDELLAQSQSALGACGRLIEPENRHVTLLFIGEWPEENLPRMAELLAVTAARHQPFRLTLDCFGTFGGARRGHEHRIHRDGRPDEGQQILWLGDSALRSQQTHPARLDTDRLEMLALVRHLRQGAAALGIEPDNRPFFPHMTITRRLPASQAEAVLTALPDFVPIQVQVTELTLMQSMPQAGHMVYHTVRAACLGMPPSAGAAPAGAASV